MSKNFLIISLGRSGSKFLFHEMNKSKECDVLHDNRNGSKLNRNNFIGEVNGISLNSGYLSMKKWTGTSGVILRNPIDICISKYNNSVRSGRVNLFEKYLYSNTTFENYTPSLGNTIFKHDLRIIDEFITNGSDIISFSKMTSDKEYLHNILNKFGIIDVPVDKLSLVKQNKWPTSVNKLPENLHKDVFEQSEWFIDKHGLYF